MIEVLLLADPLDGNDRLEKRAVLGGVPREGDLLVLENGGNDTPARVDGVVFYPDQVPEVWLRVETYDSAELYGLFDADAKHRSIHGVPVDLEEVIAALTARGTDVVKACRTAEELADWLRRAFDPEKIEVPKTHIRFTGEPS